MPTSSELEGELAAAWSKLEGACARLALVIHLARVVTGEPQTSPEQIDAPSMHTAIRLTQFFAHEALRVYGMLHEPPEERDRRKLVTLIASRGGEITPRELMRATRQAPTAEAAHRLLADLAKANYGVMVYDNQPASAGCPPVNFRLFSLPK